MAQNSYVQLNPDGLGKKIRTLDVSQIDNDGKVTTVEMQVVAIADSEGNLIDLDPRNSAALLELLIQEVRQIRFVVETTLASSSTS